jgi:hypothetical protein
MRKKSLYVSLIACLTSVGAARADILQGPVTNPANDHIYYLLTSSTWLAAEAEAVTLSGHLATISDAPENDWVFDTFAAGSDRCLWTGLNDQAVEGVFEWVSGEPLSFTNWRPGEPNNAPPGEDFVFIHGPVEIWQRTWNDWTGSPDFFGEPVHGVVEIVPEPGMMSLVALGGLAMFRRRSRRSESLARREP